MVYCGEWLVTARKYHSDNPQREISNPTGFLARTLHFVSLVRGLFYKPDHHSERWDIVLLGELGKYGVKHISISTRGHLGGLIGSVFS